MTTTMTVYRGTPDPERKPEKRSFAGIFFAMTYEGAEQYAIGEFSESAIGYVQQYEIRRPNFIDADSPEMIRLAEKFIESGQSPDDDLSRLVLDPVPLFAEGLLALGYTGIWYGDSILVLDDPKARLKRRWKVSREERFR